jgi:cytochrome c oxidase assembly protein subunit 11
MTKMTRPDPALLARRNRRMLGGTMGVVFGMVGLSFAAVPLYDLFCRMTGFGGTPMIGLAAPATPGEAVVTVRFNAATQPNLPWRFGPQQNSVRLRVGEEAVAFYTAQNTAATPVTGVSTYNVTPETVGRYFHKVACFCFEEQTLAPGQSIDMPLAFWVDPRIAPGPADARHPHHHHQLHLPPAHRGCAERSGPSPMLARMWAAGNAATR